MSVNKVIYGGKTLIDLTSDTVTADQLIKGYTAHSKSGTVIIGTNSDEINRIMTEGLTDGYKQYSDDGTIISTTDAQGRTLTKTFSNDFLTCTTVLKNQSGTVLGQTVRTFNQSTGVITTTDSKGQVLTKTFNSSMTTCTSVLKNSSGTQLAQKVETFSGNSITSVFTYN